jgi:HTH-type transcriptional regulator, sugar sensing transcriptional regulator
MLVEQKIIENLKRFDLNSYQAKLWVALLSRGVATAGELSDISNVPRSRAYDVLESLEKKGFIIMKIGKPIKYIAVPPAEVVKRVKKKIEEEAFQETDKINNLKESSIMQELEALHSHGVEKIDATELTASIKGRNNLYNHLTDLIDDAKESVILSTTSNGLIRKADALRRSLEKASKRGVKVKIAAPLNDDNKQVANDLKKFCDIRHAEVDSRFLITDSEKITFMLADDKELNASYDTGVHVNSGFFVQSIEAMFNDKWKNMRKQ